MSLFQLQPAHISPLAPGSSKPSDFLSSCCDQWRLTFSVDPWSETWCSAGRDQFSKMPLHNSLDYRWVDASQSMYCAAPVQSIPVDTPSCAEPMLAALAPGWAPAPGSAARSFPTPSLQGRVGSGIKHQSSTTISDTLIKGHHWLCSKPAASPQKTCRKPAANQQQTFALNRTGPSCAWQASAKLVPGRAARALVNPALPTARNC